MTSHEMFGGKVQLYRRGNVWWRAARVGGKRFRESTGHTRLDLAEHVTEEWYLDLRGKLRNGELEPDERTFHSAAEEYVREMRVLTIGMRSEKYVEYLELRLNCHILPYFGAMGLSKITKSVSQSYLVKRIEETIAKTGQRPARSTLLQEIVHVRQILKFSEGKGWIPYVPSLSSELLKKPRPAGAHGSRPKSTISFTRLPVAASPKERAGDGRPIMRICTIMCCFRQTPAYGPTKQPISKSAM
ncbi:hypothetical protein PIB19_05905 [Sphingomonas sp. 7/4-4]|uniref:hypothetical protein n=1 Tax=Sphingomonas sp. 7/4-4 TaxID=3018446 RepID=UPI0022F3DCB2|nr:hypothetical protein [Sphingomonas sp. 7/4-4]WBY08931.1 hypothetical protein PIB19_05905 [Sphingomonas sp. 7/4-4]